MIIATFAVLVLLHLPLLRKRTKNNLGLLGVSYHVEKGQLAGPCFL